MTLLIYYIFFGIIAATFVTGWQGFKDTPWENFSWKKFLRSYIIAIILSILFYLLALFHVLSTDNYGVLILAILPFERVVGEVIKGVLRKKQHPEYIRLFKKLKIDIKQYKHRILTGVLFLFGGILILLLFGSFAAQLEIWFGYHILICMILGLIGGLIVGISGAVKDAQYEGFKPLLFLRSPIMGFLGGILLFFFTHSSVLLAFATIGFERISVELYKTFLMRKVRGIFHNRQPKYKQWVRKRWIFFVLYFVGFIGTALFLYIK
jgi:hypothetical protein